MAAQLQLCFHKTLIESLCHLSLLNKQPKIALKTCRHKSKKKSRKNLPMARHTLSKKRSHEQKKCTMRAPNWGPTMVLGHLHRPPPGSLTELCATYYVLFLHSFEPWATLGVNFGVVYFSILLPCAYSSPLYLQDIVATKIPCFEILNHFEFILACLFHAKNHLFLAFHEPTFQAWISKLLLSSSLMLLCVCCGMCLRLSMHFEWPRLIVHRATHEFWCLCLEIYVIHMPTCDEHEEPLSLSFLSNFR